MTLKELIKEPLGTKDSLHTPVIVAKSRGYLSPGDKVLFTDTTLREVSASSDELKYHGVLNPFGPDATKGDTVIIFINPSLTENLKLRHTFDLDLKDKITEEDLDDWNCQGCY